MIFIALNNVAPPNNEKLKDDYKGSLCEGGASLIFKVLL